MHISTIGLYSAIHVGCSGKYRTEDKVKIQTIYKLNTEKEPVQNTAKQNYPDAVTFYNTWPGNEVGLFYNAPEPTRSCWKF